MDDICIHTDRIHTLQERQFDPTHTTSLRRVFASQMNKRFRKIRGLINKAIVEQDCFGLRDPGEYTAPGRRAFAFTRSQAKVSSFMEWLDRQVQNEVLQVTNIQQVGQGVDKAWTNKYVHDSYKRGVQRARYELRKHGFDVPSLEQSGGLQASMSTPFHMDRVGLLYTRVFNELKGITQAMDQQISRVLAQGLVDGDHPRLLARKLNATISGVGRQSLGITDSLGRAISPQRRARMLARTEVIRAHAAAQVQEYRNWKVEGVNVRAETVTAGDRRVCARCESIRMSGPYTLKQIEGMIPAHPQCFIDKQIPIYTSKGWKPIGNIEIGEYVLTHKGRFRKVYATIRKKRQYPKVTRLEAKGGFHLSLTSNHKMLVGKDENGLFRWISSGLVQEGNYIQMLANRCQRCNEKIPYYNKYCSFSCSSKDITDRQWSDPEHRKNMSKKASEQLKREYAEGTRDPYKITKKANEKTREMVRNGTFGWWMDEKFFNKIRQVTNTEKQKQASSERMKENNPMCNPEINKKAQASVEKYYRQNPERRLNTRMANHRKSGKMTSIEKKMSQLLDKIGVNYVFQYPILRYNVDFAIPTLKIIIECDGQYWHQDKEYDEKRQRRIEKEGWFVLRYTDDKINQCLNEIQEELSRVLLNHTGNYEFVGFEVNEVKKFVPKNGKTLYNLSVEDDESYIAKGVVVHNCRCTIIPTKKGVKRKFEQDSVANNVFNDTDAITYMQYKNAYKERLENEIGEETLGEMRRGEIDMFDIEKSELQDRFYDIIKNDKALSKLDDMMRQWQHSTFDQKAMALKVRASQVERLPSVVYTNEHNIQALTRFADEFITTDDYLKIRAFNQAYLETSGAAENFILYRGSDGEFGKRLANLISSSGRQTSVNVTDKSLAGYTKKLDLASKFGDKQGGVVIRNTFDRSDVILHPDLVSGITGNKIEEVEWVVKGLLKEKIDFRDIKFYRTDGTLKDFGETL